MSYVLCGCTTCVHHDGDGCTLDEVELGVKHVLSTEWQGHVFITKPNDVVECLDHLEVEQ